MKHQLETWANGKCGLKDFISVLFQGRLARAWGHETGNGTGPDITKNIETPRTEIVNMEATLEKLKAEFTRLENNLNEN